MAEEQKKYTLKDFTIRDVQKADGIKESTGKPWLRFKFKTTDLQAKDREFTYFPYQGLTHPEKWPYDGVKVTAMTFTITEEGKYAGDCTVKTLTLDPASQPPPAEEDPFAPSGEMPSEAPSPAPGITPVYTPTLSEQGIGKECSVCTSYAMELAKAMIANGFNGDQVKESLGLVCDVVGTQGFHLYLHLKAYMEKERAVKT